MIPSGSNKYKVTSQGKEVAYAGPANKNKATSVTIPDKVQAGGITYNVTSIGDKAFEKCTKLTKVTISKNVKSIGKNAFAGCTKLNKVTFKSGSKCKTIGANAFKGDKALKSISLPNSVQKIGDNAFANCKGLQTVTTGTGLKEIGKQAFNGDKALTKLTIRSTKLTKVGSKALKGINAKATIKVPKSKLKDYKKLLKGKGQGKKVQIKK